MDSEIWLQISIAFYIFVATIVAWYAFVVKKSSPFEPIGHYIGFLSLFTLPLPIRALITTTDIVGDVSPFLPTIIGYLPVAVFMTALSLPLFAAGYYSRLAVWLAKRTPHPPELAREHPFRAFVFLAALSFFLLSLLAQEAGGLLTFVLKGYGSAEEMFGRGYLAVGFTMSFIASLFLLYDYARKRTALRLSLFLAFFGVVVAMQVFMGNRGQIMYFGLVIATFYNFAIAPIRFVKAVPLLVLAFLALNILGMTRGSDYKSVDEFIEAFSRNAGQVQDAAGGHGLFYTLTVGEFLVPFESLPQVMSLVDNEEPLLFGASYLRAPIYLIPSAIYTDRPATLTKWYMSRVYGGGEKVNEGRAFFFLAEAYLNFGAFGVLTLGLVWGVLWGALQQWIRLRGAGLASVLVYAVLVAFLFRCIAGDASTLVAGVTQQSLAPLVLGILIMTGFRPWRSQTVTNHRRREFAA